MSYFTEQYFIHQPTQNNKNSESKPQCPCSNGLNAKPKKHSYYEMMDQMILCTNLGS